MKKWIHSATLSAQKDNLEKVAAPVSQWEKSNESERGITFWSKDFEDGTSADISSYWGSDDGVYEVRIDLKGGDWNKKNGGRTLWGGFNYDKSDDPLKDAKAWADNILKENGYQ